MDKEDNAFEDFRGWWFAPEQDGLRLNVAEGNGFRIWLASRSVIEIELPEIGKYCAGKAGYSPIYDIHGFESYVKEAIASHRITIKEETK